MKITFKIIITVLFLISLIITPVQAQAIDKVDYAVQKSLNSLRSGFRINADIDYNVVSAEAIVLPELSYEVYKVKILDATNNFIHSFWYDSNLNPITEGEAFSNRAIAYEKNYGKLSIDLFKIITGQGANTENISVAIWANQSNEESISNLSQQSYSHKIFLPIILKPGPIDWIVSFLVVNGYSPNYISENAPIVYADIPTKLINELQSQSYVAAIYSQKEASLAMDSATRTSAAPWTWERGITGSGVKIAILENDGVAFDNPYLNGSQYFISWWPRVGSHATEVAGVISSTHSTYRGIAYGAEILSANALSLGEPFVVAATDWAISQNVDVINASFGTICGDTDIESMDKYFDWVVWNKMKTVVVAAGNLRSECPSNHNVGSPGKGYNVITVGAKNDQNTATSTDDVKDDIFSYFSLYVDPNTTSENRLKPEVVATGQRIRSTSDTSSWITSEEIAGTSFSAPIVAGEAALMMQRSSWLKYSPEAVKAGIMATARWTLLHDDQDYDRWASIDKMGIGSIDVTAADNSLINNRVRELYLEQNDLSNGYYDVVIDGCPQGERFRTVITWPSHPSRSILNWILHDRLETDFDLTVRAANGQVYGSYADEANYEIVEFTSPQTGQATIRIHLSRWDNASVTERLGLSYYCGSPLD